MTEVSRVVGPGSMSVNVPVNFDTLRQRLIEAGHPLGHAPQWDGDKVWAVKAWGDCGDLNHYLVIKSKTRERAEEIAKANLRSISKSNWELEIREVVFGSKQLLLSTSFDSFECK